MAVEQRPIPAIVNQTDAIIRVSSAAICGPDLHVYHGLHGSAEPGWIQGHEAVGYVNTIGSGVNYHSVRDYIVIPDKYGTGHYPMLEHGAEFTEVYGPGYLGGNHLGECQGALPRFTLTVAA